MNFKIIALEILDGCTKRHSKNLQKNLIYYFYNQYLIDKNNGYDKIRIDKSKNIDLFSQDETLKISISAIVGKNGSGKSTIIDLIIKGINNFAYQYRQQNPDKKIHQVDYVGGIDIIIYYQKSESVILKLHIKNKACKIYECVWDDNRKFFINRGIASTDLHLSHLFYTEIINYSLYAYNSSIEGGWISKLFHKNDSYQTPIVLNPFRKNGVIDVNIENALIFQRLMANLFRNENIEIEIGENLVVENLILKLAPERRKFKYYNDKQKKDLEFSLLKFDNEIKDEIIKKLLEAFYNYSIDKIKITGKLYDNAKSYILYKLISICQKYDEYDYFDFKTIKFKNLENLIDHLRIDNSHITFKLRQTINYLIFDHIEYDEQKNINFVKVKKLAKNINKIRGHENIIKFIPPPIFNIDLNLKSVNGSETEIRFSNLSSGEKQLIYSLNSIYYHLIYLDSVASSNGNKTYYKDVNIILEEIELYFHPEFQRQYIKLLLDGLYNIGLERIKSINIIFVTHSPFILSDIPQSNVMYLEVKNGISVPIKQEKKSFSANIHHLLTDNFFLKNNIYIGSFAHSKLKMAIGFINTYDEKSAKKEEILYWYNFLEIIDEPIIKNKLLEMFTIKFQEFSKERFIDIKKEKVLKFAEEMGISIHFQHEI
ncbi:hypothetical protein [Flavobacterium sp. FlaQc-50]|jgi:predicted ATP-binding protein involved in virulence|uniref:hypothetical protein n=1 Tax=unclassified Flavobacterium TaxID=196869 RepID=UPI0037565877